MYADKHTHKQQKGLYKCTYSYRNTDRKEVGFFLAEYPTKKDGVEGLDRVVYWTNKGGEEGFC